VRFRVLIKDTLACGLGKPRVETPENWPSDWQMAALPAELQMPCSCRKLVDNTVKVKINRKLFIRTVKFFRFLDGEKCALLGQPDPRFMCMAVHLQGSHRFVLHPTAVDSQPVTDTVCSPILPEDLHCCPPTQEIPHNQPQRQPAGCTYTCGDEVLRKTG